MQMYTEAEGEFEEASGEGLPEFQNKERDSQDFEWFAI